MVLAALTSVIWGLAFVAVKFGLAVRPHRAMHGRVVVPALIFGEVFSSVRYAGMALILGGLAVIVLPTDWTQVLSAGGRRH